MSDPANIQPPEGTGSASDGPAQQQGIRQKRPFTLAPVARNEHDGSVKRHKQDDPTTAKLASPFHTPSTAPRSGAAELDNFARMLAAGAELGVNMHDLAKGVQDVAKRYGDMRQLLLGKVTPLEIHGVCAASNHYHGGPHLTKE